MVTPVPAPVPDPSAPQAASDDLSATRRRILDTALTLFSAGGYDKVSVRDIAQTAHVNVAAISYHFGGKPGLYRAALTEPMGSCSDDIPLFDQASFTLRQSLEGLYDSLLVPFTRDLRAQQCLRLHLREMLDPTGVWTEQVQNDFRPAHEALIRVLQRHLCLQEVDDDLMRLSLSITGLGLHYYLSRDVVDVMRPALLASPQAVALLRDRLVDHAEALVFSEAARRGLTAPRGPLGSTTPPLQNP